MDGVIVDFDKSFNNNKHRLKHPQSEPGFWVNLDPIQNAVESVNFLRNKYDVWILTAPSHKNAICYSEKRLSIEKLFDLEFCEKLIIANDKSLFKGDYLIDDAVNKGQESFDGELIRFDSEKFPGWKEVIEYIEK